jgi:GDP/UDP-N,N'-diacetylbacillosamine 2-epimerase (hydrolysing)
LHASVLPNFENSLERNGDKIDFFFKLEIIAFGTHLSKYHGFTLNEIEKEGFNKIHQISSLISNDDEQSISTSYGITALKFADFWGNNNFDLVFCLGDRFEMSAAVQAGIPFGIKFAHIHGGETTLGAIDNIYRHQITLASKLHFTSTEVYSRKIEELTGNSINVHTVGSLSLDTLSTFTPMDRCSFFRKFNIAKDDFALITFHPETVAKENNEVFAMEMRKALQKISDKLFLVISMPNADTLGSLYREQLYWLTKNYPNKVVCIENFGKVNYFNAMYYSALMIGNTSSGIIEGASFGKYVINVGDRQQGRVSSSNVFNVKFQVKDIVETTEKALKLGIYKGENIYVKNDAASLIIDTIKDYYEAI